MYKYDWDTLLTPELMSRIASAAGVARASQIEPLKPALTRVLESSGGLPIIEKRPDATERTAMGLRLMHDAVRHTLIAMGASSRATQPTWGYVVLQSKVPQLASTITAIDRAPLNRASADLIATATGISAQLAARIVEERRARGAFRTAEDLDKRMRGVDARNRDRIAATVRFDDPTDRVGAQVQITNDFDRDLSRLVSLQEGSTPETRLASAVETVAYVCAAQPHPSTTARRVRTAATLSSTEGTDVDWVGILASEQYYESLIMLFDEAKKSIDVCMFHIACPSEEHPTRKVLRALENAKKRRVAVRVLMDRDRREDPYKSTIINAPARRLLEKARVPVRYDRASKLLHSKFVVIDAEKVVMGSHNWSAGSYFEFDDLTLVLSSKQLASQLTARYEELWGQGK